MVRYLRGFASILIIRGPEWACIPVRQAHAATGPLCYVDADATGGANNGSSWADAYMNLQKTLPPAFSDCQEI